MAAGPRGFDASCDGLGVAKRENAPQSRNEMYLSLKDIFGILYSGERIELPAEEMAMVASCHEFLETFKQDKIIYGINTGFGPMAQYRVGDDDLIALQYNIIRSHSCGAGEAMPLLAVRGAMVSRLMTFMQCRSGISPEVVRLLAEFINRGVYPYIPQHGSVGASGDLVQLSHLALTLIGEGKVSYKGEWRATADVMGELGLSPLTLRGRDGLSVVNGTSMMTGVSLTNIHDARRLTEWAIAGSVMLNEIVESYDDLMDARLNAVRRQEGQQKVAELMRGMAKGSGLLRKRDRDLYHDTGRHDGNFGHKVQPFYSLRCVPQIIGPVWETIENMARIVENEVNSADDNPIVDPEARNIFHGGNFHGDYISLENDKLKIVMTRVAQLAERQTNYLLHDKVNGLLPPFVNLGRLGLDYGMQACQFTATSTTAECQTLSNPMYVHTIPCNNDNQDIVSMGTNSALLCRKVVDNTATVLAIALMTMCQGVDCRKVYDRMGETSRKVYDTVRGVFAPFSIDREHYTEIASVERLIMGRDVDSL